VMSIEIETVTRDGRPLGKITVPRDGTVQQFKEAFQSQNKRHPHPHRQWWTVETSGGAPAPVKDGPISAIPFVAGKAPKLIYKDLGPQVPWRLVFLTEYFGPGVIHSLFYLLPQVFYSDPVSSAGRHRYQTLAYACVMLHYLKRLYESAYVHRFSNPTMPIRNIFKNCAHYWMLGGLFIAYYVYHPLFTPTALGDTVVYALAAVFVLAELGNLHAHITLRDLRPAGTKTRGVPRGGMFEFVTCANYTYELLAWLVFAIFTQTFTSWLFFVVSFAQIAEWAVKKHKLQKAEFASTGQLPKGRKILIPFIF